MTTLRCGWCNQDSLYIDYHDNEWGVPVHDDRLLFEFLILEGMQAGLSWYTVLKKRAHFREAFADFDPKRIARFDEQDVERLMNDKGIIRNRLKIHAAIKNARATLEVIQNEGRFNDYLWSFVNGRPIQNRWATLQEVPSHTPESDAMSKALKKRGFTFVGSTICYAFMQAVGMVNDHTLDCFKHPKESHTT